MHEAQTLHGLKTHIVSAVVSGEPLTRHPAGKRTLCTRLQTIPASSPPPLPPNGVDAQVKAYLLGFKSKLDFCWCIGECLCNVRTEEALTEANAKSPLGCLA
ncbi:hypothetical protein A0H81_11934 [Grifola frondosa]|uniref:Uncharacterized protein n=1 Tax=Grifola frondosa TaxID=5627 RepID=A0A1C7LVT7_GRIFR|nr:hypothetical protein A0H81_11934 [Grifola frondosa]